MTETKMVCRPVDQVDLSPGNWFEELVARLGVYGLIRKEIVRDETNEVFLIQAGEEWGCPLKTGKWCQFKDFPCVPEGGLKVEEIK